MRAEAKGWRVVMKSIDSATILIAYCFCTKWFDTGSVCTAKHLEPTTPFVSHK